METDLKNLGFSTQLEFTLGIASLASLPSIDESIWASGATTHLEKLDASSEKTATVRDLTPLDSTDGDVIDDSSKFVESRDLSPSETDTSHPTGGLVDDFDEDYCGWLAEGI